MEKSVKHWKVLLLFALACVLLVIMLPRNATFKYEFQLGKQWLEEDIVTPFDFPIYKTSEELETDRSEVLTSYKPYFRRDITVVQQQISAFSNYFANTFGDKYLPEKNVLVDLLDAVYTRGILRKTDIPKDISSRVQLVVSVLTNNVSEDFPLSELFTPGDAYNFILTNFNKKFADNTETERVFANSNIRNFIQTNLSYDEQTTTQIKNRALNDISQTKGVVPAGTKLIANGEVINSNNIQILESFKKEYANRENFGGNYSISLLGQILFVAICMLMLYFLLRWSQPEMISTFPNITFILLIILLTVLASTQVLKAGLSIYLVPLAIVPIYISTFFRTRAAMFVFITVILLLAFYVPNTFEFVFLTFAAGIAASSEFQTWYRRGRLFISVGLVLLAYVVTYIVMNLVQEGSFNTIRWEFMYNFIINVLILLTAYQLIYVFEKIFGFLSNNTLMELSDTNRALLRELAEKAPGTFQHSMQVANLAEEVVRTLNGDTLLTRVGALYHDIGKTMNPDYFVENQQMSGSVSLHEGLKPEESAKILIKHVEDGVTLAKKHNIPSLIINFIRTHHATSKTYYFYSKYKEAHPDATDFSMFSYPGPNPSTKEEAVVMMADSIEAASRALKEITPETINNLVEDIVNRQISNGCMQNADLTFNEISIAKETFKRKLQNIYHSRVVYPKMKDEK